MIHFPPTVLILHISLPKVEKGNIIIYVLLNSLASSATYQQVAPADSHIWLLGNLTVASVLCCRPAGSALLAAWWHQIDKADSAEKEIRHGSHFEEESSCHGLLVGWDLYAVSALVPCAIVTGFRSGLTVILTSPFFLDIPSALPLRLFVWYPFSTPGSVPDYTLVLSSGLSLPDRSPADPPWLPSWLCFSASNQHQMDYSLENSHYQDMTVTLCDIVKKFYYSTLVYKSIILQDLRLEK